MECLIWDSNDVWLAIRSKRRKRECLPTGSGCSTKWPSLCLLAAMSLQRVESSLFISLSHISLSLFVYTVNSKKGRTLASWFSRDAMAMAEYSYSAMRTQAQTEQGQQQQRETRESKRASSRAKQERQERYRRCVCQQDEAKVVALLRPSGLHIARQRVALQAISLLG